MRLLSREVVLVHFYKCQHPVTPRSAPVFGDAALGKLRGAEVEAVDSEDGFGYA